MPALIKTHQVLLQTVNTSPYLEDRIDVDVLSDPGEDPLVVADAGTGEVPELASVVALVRDTDLHAVVDGLEQAGEDADRLLVAGEVEGQQEQYARPLHLACTFWKAGLDRRIHIQCMRINLSELISI